LHANNETNIRIQVCDNLLLWKSAESLLSDHESGRRAFFGFDQNGDHYLVIQ